MSKWLVRALMETIDEDESIVNEPFYVDSIRQRYLKKKLLEMTEAEFQPFLLGIWHFILVHRPDNSVGKRTVGKWLDQGGTARSKKKFVSDVGENWSADINVKLIDPESLDSEEDEEADPYVVPSNMDALLLPG